MFTFGTQILSIGQSVTYTTAGRKITGTVASLPYGSGEWIDIDTKFKTCPRRKVSVRCGVRPETV